jgi:hypothetical protein
VTPPSPGGGWVVVPLWITATVRWKPPPVTVTVPERLVVAVFAVALTVNEPLFDPAVGETVSHVALSETLQVTFAATVTSALDAVEPNGIEVGETLSVLGAGPNTVAGTDVCVMPLAPPKRMLPQLVRVVLKFVTRSRCVQHPPLPDHDQPM